ncbi:very-short-patch-repair endonuclease [Mesorhizobium shonense]|uniref:Very-short-patch-repair endonuclease n=1 Tax=Mesorhizobium shonense TaxID=1209948 RepID=A0ABV2HNM9_9HYPH
MRGSAVRGPVIETTKRARRLRQSDNDAENALWIELRDRRLNGNKFVRQFPIGPYFADFACRECQLVVEVDGSQHFANKRDQIRDRFMVSAGWSILRFWNIDVLKEREAVLETILAAVEQRLERHIDTHDLRFFAAEGYGETYP